MKSFSSYLKLKEKWTIPQFIESLFEVYDIQHDHLNLQQKRIIEDYFDIYQYPQDQSVVIHLYHRMEYIYNEKDGGLCIHNEGYQKGYRYIDYLLTHQLIQTSRIPISDSPIAIDMDHCQQVMQWLETYENLPIVYINYEQVVDPDYLARQLRGIAHVMYETSYDVSLWMKEHCQLIPPQSRVILYYLNHDYKAYRFFKKESQDQLQQRILHHLSLYLKQRRYGTSYDFHSLQKRYLEELKNHAQDYEEETVYQLDQEMEKLENEKIKYSELISQLENEVELLKMQNEMLEEQMSLQNQYGLLNKGDIQEYYQGEQKDILLNMLEDDVKKKTVGNLDMSILEDILQQNAKDGIREEYLNCILKALISSYDIYKLKSYGITIKDEKNKHPIAMFFDNPRYQTTLSSTPSDQNACRQIYRQFRKYFF